MALKLYPLWGTLLFALVLTILLMSPSSVYADTTITVNTLDDGPDTNADCSLRDAIRAANLNAAVDACPAGSGDDLILLPSGIYTLTLTGQGEDEALTGDLDITAPESLTIQGAGVVSTTIDGGGIDRIFHILLITSTVTIADLTIQNGEVATGQGSGGIKNNGVLTLTNTLIQNNRATGNSSSDTGGGICNGCGTGTGTLHLHNSTIKANSADRGGGIFSNALLTITQSSIISNSARAGGGLTNFASSEGSTTIINSTFSGNSAINNGGAIAQSAGTLIITNSTLANNTSALGGGIIHSDGTTTLQNSILASNGAGGDCYNFGGISSNGHNLSSDDSCSLNASGDLTNTVPLLGPLADNGGATLTHALLFASPAIDTAADALCPSTDQRGITRPQGDRCDIGAVEYNAVLLKLFLPSGKK
jgi:CSLREA domain-containing protein